MYIYIYICIYIYIYTTHTHTHIHMAEEVVHMMLVTQYLDVLKEFAQRH